jgi:exopolysaccharide production protein ExoZ
LRALAALAVVWHHLQTEMAAGLGWPHLGFAGRAGVDVFFVISGFIMFHTTQDHSRSTLDFWKDRVIRIAPLYWLATLAATSLFWLGVHPGDIKALSVTDVIEDMLFLPHYRADLDTYPALDVGWTLNYEMFFYFLFGLTFFLKSQAKALAALTAVFIAGAVAVHFHAPMPHAVSVWLEPITLEFAAGGALALLYRRNFSVSAGTQRIAGLALLFVGFAALGWFGVRDGEYMSWFYELRALEFGIPATLIVAGALLLERSGSVARSPFLLLLGGASYAIYLVHHVIVEYLVKAAAAVLPVPGAGPILVPVAIAMFVLAAGAGIAAHLWIEKPITRLLKRRPSVPVATQAPALHKA